LFQASLGVHLEDNEAKAFALACRSGSLGIQDVRAVAGLSVDDAQAVLNRLLVQGVVTPATAGKRSHVVVAEHLREPLEARMRGESLVSDQPREDSGNLVTDQPAGEPAKSVTDQPKPLKSLTETQWQIVDLCDVPRTMADLMAEIGVTHRPFFRKTHLGPLVDGGVLNMTHPENPNHPKQSYVLSEIGVELKARRMEAGDEE
jgi:ATP-dependent DNA helicase RecG